jgi:protein-tyrosine-phosphatase
MKGAIVVLLLGAAPALAAQPRRTVVIVCEHGSVKSLIAAEWFNRLARERGVAFRAVSRGVIPDDSVPPPIADALRRDGFDVKGFAPRGLEPSELTAAARIVAIGVDGRAFPPTVGGRVEKWDAIPPTSEGYEATREALKARVLALIDTLEPKQRQ